MSTRRSRTSGEDESETPVPYDPQSKPAETQTTTGGTEVVPLDEQDVPVPGEEKTPEEVAEERAQRQAEMEAHGVFAQSDDENALERAKDPDTAPGTPDVEGEEQMQQQQAKQAEKERQRQQEQYQHRTEQAQKRADRHS